MPLAAFCSGSRDRLGRTILVRRDCFSDSEGLRKTPRPKAEALFSGSRDGCGRASARASGIVSQTLSYYLRVSSHPATTFREVVAHAHGASAPGATSNPPNTVGPARR